MPSFDSENLKLTNTRRNSEDDSSSSDQQFEQQNVGVLTINKTKTQRSRSNQSDSQDGSFFMGDLIKMIQISLIIVLVFFVCFLGYAILDEVRQFWFQGQTLDVTVSDQFKRNQPIIKMQLIEDKTLKRPDNIQNLQIQPINPEIQSKINDKDEFKIQNQNDLKLINDKIESQKDYKDINNDQKTIYKLQNKQILDHEKSVMENLDIQNQQTQLEKFYEFQEKNKEKGTQQMDQNLLKANPQLLSPFLPIQLELNQMTQKSVDVISPKEIISQVKTQQIYDPVLVQMDKMKKRAGGKFKDTIYTMRGTNITQNQYEIAKKLIQITQYYNPKTKSFNVKNSPIGSNQCGAQDVDCSKKQKNIDTIVTEEIKYYEQKYKKPYKQLKSQLAFCVIVPSYKNNHNENIFRNLNSIFQQQYSNFHVIYIDDYSQDGTPQKVKQYTQKYEIPPEKLTLLVNEENQKALKNIYNAAHNYCQQKQIMMIVDGDDYLIGTQVFKLFNFQYQTKKLLAAYTNYLRINEPYYIKVGTSTAYTKDVMKKRIFRKNHNIFRASHLRSFYVDLFRKIKIQDLQDSNGNFFTAANDFAIMMPILEMSAPNFQYIPQLTYLYDSGTGLNNFQSKIGVQAANTKLIAKRKTYNQVDLKKFYPIKDEKKEEKVKK